MGESSTGPTGSLSAVLETAMPGDWDVMGVADCRSAAAIRVLMVGSDGDSPLGSEESPIKYNTTRKRGYSSCRPSSLPPRSPPSYGRYVV